MLYSLKPGKPLINSVREIGAEHSVGILSYLSGNVSQGEKIHQARKAIKRLRALLGLIRPAISNSDYRTSQEDLKNVARSVAGLRDAQAMLGTVTKIGLHDPTLGAGSVAKALRARLEEQCKSGGHNVSRSVRTAARKTVKKVGEAFEQLTMSGENFQPIARSLENNYRDTLQAFAYALECEEDEAFHEWRKRVQRHWRYLQLLEASWPKGIQPHIVLAHELAETLGEDHDYFVLATLVEKEAANLGSKKAVRQYAAHCREYQQVLREKATLLGNQCFAEKPRSFATRMSVYWESACAQKS
jgi:CHAD domain-containing protein